MITAQGETIPLHLSGRSALPFQTERADAAANRRLILATARRLFAERGVSAVCMTTMAEVAGVGKGTLYRRFANKGLLCLALMDEDMQQFQEAILTYFRQRANQAALAQLDFFLDNLIRFMDSHAPLLREAQQHQVLQSADLNEDTPHHWFQQTISALLERAQANGETGELDIPYLTDAILAPLNANLFVYQRQVLRLDLDRISQGLRSLLLYGLTGQTLP